MTSDEFVMWLLGALEMLETDKGLDASKVQMIREHLNLVRKKVTPNFGDVIKKSCNDGTTFC